MFNTSICMHERKKENETQYEARYEEWYIIFYSDSLEKQKDLIREEQVRVEIQVVR